MGELVANGLRSAKSKNTDTACSAFYRTWFAKNSPTVVRESVGTGHGYYSGTRVPINLEFLVKQVSINLSKFGQGLPGDNVAKTGVSLAVA